MSKDGAHQGMREGPRRRVEHPHLDAPAPGDRPIPKRVLQLPA